MTDDYVHPLSINGQLMKKDARIAELEALTKRLVNVVEFLNATHNSGDAGDIIAEARAALEKKDD